MMKVKRLLAALMAATMIVGLAACGSSDDPASSASSATASQPSGTEAKKEFTVWGTGSDNVNQMMEMLVKDFNENSEYAGQYTATLNWMLSGTGAASLADSIAAAFQANQSNTDFDVVEFGNDEWSKTLAQTGTDAFIELDKSKIPNAETVEAEQANGTAFIQPYRGTTVVLAYNGDVVTDVPETLDELISWIKANPGRFAYNTPGTGGAADSFCRSLVYNYLPEEAASSEDEKWVEEWEQGFADLADLHQYMYKSGGSTIYPNKNQGALDLLASGDIDMCPMWADMVLSQRAAGTVPSNIKITTIQPAFTGDAVGWAIPVFGSNIEGAYAWINYILSPEAQQMLVENMAAIPLIDASTMDLTGFEDLASLDVTNFRTLSIGGLGSVFNEKWDNEIGTLG